VEIVGGAEVVGLTRTATVTLACAGGDTVRADYVSAAMRPQHCAQQSRIDFVGKQYETHICWPTCS